MYIRCLVLALLILLKKNCSVSAAYSATTNLMHNNFDGCSSDDGSLVCATNGLDFVIFPNECLMRETNREKYLGATDFRKMPISFCQNNCNLMCTTAYQPVCFLDPATNVKRTFTNECEMMRDSCLTKVDWRHHRNGKCIELETPETTTSKISSHPPKSKVSIPCNRIFNPVCAMFAGVKSTFGNECLVNAENLKTGNDWEVFATGVCAEDYGVNSNENSIKESIPNVRSTARKSYPAPYSLNVSAELGDDVHFIYAPAVFETQFIEENGAELNINQNYKPDFRNGQAPKNDLDQENSSTITENPDLQNDCNLQDYQNLHKDQNLLNCPKMTEAPDVASLQESDNNAAVTSNSSMNGNEKPQQVKPIRFLNDNIEEVTECIFGSVEICGILEEDDEQRSFGNICELMLRNIFLNQTWTFLHDGKCNKSACILNCNKDHYDPVCVSKNGINYTMANDCYVNYNNCEKERNAWKTISKGACESPNKFFIRDKYESPTLGFPYISGYNGVATTTTPKVTATTTLSPSKSAPTAASTTILITPFTRKFNRRAEIFRFITLSTKSPQIPAFSLSSATSTTSTEKPQFKSNASTFPPVPEISTTRISTATSALTRKNINVPTSKLSSQRLTALTSTSTTSTTPTFTALPEFSTTSNSNTRISIYGSQPHSVIMRLVKSKAKKYEASA